ncbi:MAG: hypothetical protein JST93_11935 [Acidobacteria bacterium]|nr:hypothetical protein [Acidobacteriota bacterium]
MRRVLSFPVMLCAALVFLTLHTCAGRFDDPDLWWHLQTGKRILTERAVPTADNFSFTAAGQPWLTQEWLADLLLAATFQTYSEQGLHILFVSTASAIVILGYILCGFWSGNWKTSIIGGILILYFLTTSLTIRPALIGLLFLSAQLILLWQWQYGRGKLTFLLPLLTALWANTHASFLLGLLAIAAITAWRIAHRQSGWQWLPLSVAAACLTPHGIATLAYPIEVLFHQPDNLNNIAEWAPLSLAEPRAAAFLIVIAFILAAHVRNWIRLQPIEWLLLSTGSLLAIQHVRMLPIFGLLAAPILCRILAGWWETYDAAKDQPVFNTMLILIAAISAPMLLPAAADIRRQIAVTEPSQAVAAVRQLNLSGPMINDYTWGGYLIWALPEHKVFIDGRADLYAPLGILKEYRRWALLEEDPSLLLDRHGIRFCFLRRSAPVAQALRYMPAWKLAYQDDQAVIFARR